MRNLKRVLALALVFSLVLTLGMTAMAAPATDYPDWDDIGATHQADVAFLQYDNGGYYVMGGDANGFRPEDTLTRAEFATIAARISMGGAIKNGKELTNAEMFGRFVSYGTSQFSDVTAADWFAGPVGYCVANGIVSGVGNNKFAPQDTVTDVQVFKMLLCLLGFDGKDFEGSGWDFKVLTAMTKNKIALDTKVINSDITREEVASAVVAALKANTFKLDANGKDYVEGTKTLLKTNFANNFVEFADGADVEGILVKNKYADISTGTTGLDGDVFIALLDTDGVTLTGELAIIKGAPDDAAPTSMIGARIKITAAQIDKTNVYNYISGKNATLVDALVNVPIAAGTDKYDDQFAAGYTNASSGADTAYYPNNYGGKTTAAGLSSEANWDSAFANTRTEGYAFRIPGKNVYRAVFNNLYTLGKVTKIADDKITVKDLSGDTTVINNIEISKVENGSKLAVDDCIAVMEIRSGVAGTGKWVWKPVTRFVGKMTAYNAADKKATIDGTTYSLLGSTLTHATAVGSLATEINKTGNFGTEQAYYLYNGKIVEIKSTAVDPDATYCIVLAANPSSNGSTALSGYDKAKVQILKDDGSKGVYEVDKLTQGSNEAKASDSAYIQIKTDGDRAVGFITPVHATANTTLPVYKYTVSSDGKTVELTEVSYANTAFTSATYTNGNTGAISNSNVVAVNSDTIWFVLKGTATNADHWSVFKGTSLPTITVAATTAIQSVYSLKDNAIQFAVLETASALTVSTKDYLYATSEPTYEFIGDKLTAKFSAFDLKTGTDLGVISLVPGKKANGTADIASNDAGIVKGQILEYTKDGEYYKGDIRAPITDVGGTQGAPEKSAAMSGVDTWYQLYATNYVNGNFKQIDSVYGETAVQVTTNASTVASMQAFIAKSGAVIIDVTDGAKKAALGDYSTTQVATTLANTDTYYGLIIHTTDAGVIDMIIVTDARATCGS